MIGVAPDRPYEPGRTRMAVRGRVVVKLAAGEGPEDLPHYLETRHGRGPAATGVDGGPVDRVLAAHSPASRVSRAFRAAREQRVGAGTRPAWDDLERTIGLSRTLRIDVDPRAGLLGLCHDLASLSSVESASPAYLCSTPFAAKTDAIRPFDAHAMIGAARALAFEPGDSTVIVAVIDSGVAFDHVELADRCRNGGDTVDLPHERLSRGMTLIGDIAEPDRIPRDEMGHGTACASIIAARGLAVARGVGGACWVLPMRALAGARVAERKALTAVGAVLDIDEACKLAVDLGARVLNLSFGTPESALRDDDPRPHADVVEYARRRGCILVAASGNDARSSAYYPAALDGVIAVGSVGASGRPSSFMTRGPHVALCAPGERVRTAALHGYQDNTGTSFAAPFVAGACALLLARAARYGVPLDGADARALLVATARPFDRGVEATGCGAGILDIPAALEALERALADDPRPPIPHDHDPVDFDRGRSAAP